MKTSKLIDFFKEGNLVIPIYILKCYKNFQLKMEEFIFLMYLYNLGNKVLFDPNKYIEDLNIELNDVMNYIEILTDKGLVQVDVLKNEKGFMEEYLVLDGFYNKLALFTMDKFNNDKTKSNSDIFSVIEKEFGRTLGSYETEIISAWLESNVPEELIKEALKEATLNGVFSLKYINKILYEWEKAGITTVEGVEERRKKHRKKQEKESDIDLDIVDWNWFDEDE